MSAASTTCPTRADLVRALADMVEADTRLAVSLAAHIAWDFRYLSGVLTGAEILAAVAAGVTGFSAIAIVADTREPISPCGACRQVMAEFGDFKIIKESSHNHQRIIITEPSQAASAKRLRDIADERRQRLADLQ